MAVTTAMIKELRERTAAGMLDCKKALEEANCDMEQAVDVLRTKGLSAAAKKSGRISSEGLIASTTDGNGKMGALFEINCETDFVAKNDDFKKLCQNFVDHVAKFEPADMDALNEQKLMGEGDKIAEMVLNTTATIGEKISPRRFVRWEAEGNNLLDLYIHGPGKMGIMVELTCGKEASSKAEAVTGFAHKLAMQVAATNPTAVKREDVAEEFVAREREVYMEQVRESGKPEKIWDRIIEGKMEKFFKESTLIEQQWVHDTDKTVGQVLIEVGKEVDDEIGVKRILRWGLGEGLVKRVHDIAAEVAEQLNK